MKIKRGDRFKLSAGTIIEYTGTKINQFVQLWRVVNNSTKDEWRVGQLLLIDEGDIIKYWERIEPAKTDPLIREALREMDDLDFARKFAEACMIIMERLEDTKKQAYAAILRDVLPLELKRQIRPGELCENCNKEISDIIEDIK